MTPLKIGIILGTTRPGRHVEQVAKWLEAKARTRADAEFEIVDLADYHLPLLDEPMPPSMGNYTQDHTKVWSAKIASFDGFIFVTPEYNHSIPGALKNAIDFLYNEWTNKAAAMVAYGALGGSRAIEHLRGVLSEVQIAHVRTTLTLSLFDDFEKFTEFRPRPRFDALATTMLDQLVAWAGALKSLRPPTVDDAGAIAADTGARPAVKQAA